jgi:zinc-dependent metalloproteinase lipoprotein
MTKMKNLKLLFLFALCLPFVAGCSDGDDEAPYVEVSQSSFTDLDATATTLTLKITSNASWTVTSDASWCVPLKAGGEGTADVQLNIAENIDRGTRTARITVVVAGGVSSQTVTVSQKVVVPDDNYHYKLPVVFHVIYSSKSNTKQYVKTGWLETILADVNKLYKSSGVDLNLEFVLATEDPDGNKMEEPGVHRIQWANARISCREFMGYTANTPQKYIDLMWDQDRYINVCLYTFTEEGILGISTFPYTIQPDHLEGLSVLAYEVDYTNIPYPHCVSINNDYIYDHDAYYSSSDIVATLTHELGHYLGLRHAFSENDEDQTGSSDWCIDSDFCEDTPTYNKAEYDDYLLKYWGNSGTMTQADYEVLVMRNDCKHPGVTFRSTNVMDYAISDADRFTADQATRMRYVMLRSPFIPGPKIRTPEQQQPSSRTPIHFEMKAYE